MMQLAKLIRLHRVARGWRQQDLAAAAGVCRETIGQLERGTRVPLPRTMAAVCRALELPLPAGVADGPT